MSNPSPFDIGRQIGNNFQKLKEDNAIESILSEAMRSNDPVFLQNSIGKILSQVSPERQGQAIQFLQNTANNIRQKEAAAKYGIDTNLPPALQTAMYKEGQKNQRIQNADKIFNQSNNQPARAHVNGMINPDEFPPASEQPQLNNKVHKDRLLTLTGHPDREVAERAKAELKELQKAEQENRADLRELRKETLPLKKAIIEKADLSRESIRNKNHLLEIIDRGNINDPTFAIFAESLPMNLGKRLLSPDTVEYKGALVDEFGDLKNIFKGATRVKEVDIYENKLPDLYLNDTQKKAILKSRVNTAKMDLIREEAAAEVEEKYPNISALQFNKKVEQIAKPKIDALFDVIWDEQKSVIDQAEKYKKIPLDYDDPDARQIAEQIMKEAGGNRQKAREIAKKKGYNLG